MTALRILALALAAVLVYALYLPSAHPPQRFFAQLRLEHDLNVALWGADGAHRILARALALYDQREALVPAAFAATPSVPVTAANAAVAGQMSDLVQRLLHSGYAQGFDAMVLLATYRASALGRWLPSLAGILLLACFDGSIVRLIRSKEFLAPSPARFALCATGAMVALPLTLLLLVTPVCIDPTLLGGVPLAMALLIAGAIGHFHR
jgi:NAD(P)-dependent dehydrogenase (short-subunit alcohol dehydrogenase family)